MSYQRLAFAVFILFGLVACEGDITRQHEQVSPTKQASYLLNPQATQDELAGGVAASIAAQMSGVEFQMKIRGLLRSSALVEHKVELGDLLGSEAGETLLSAAARDLAGSVGDIQANLRRLPPLDFYVPLKEQRLAWVPGDPFVVGYTASPNDTTVQAYLPSGEQIHLSRNTVVSSQYTLFLLHPAEYKSRRFGSAVPTAGPHIQSKHDHDIGGSVNVVGPNGALRTVELADLPIPVRSPVQVRDGREMVIPTAHMLFNPSATPPIAASITYSKGTWLNWDQFFTADGFGACEIYSHQTFYRSGVRVQSSRFPVTGSYGGIPCSQPNNPPPVVDYFTAGDGEVAFGGFGAKVLDHGLYNANEEVRRIVHEDDQFSNDSLLKYTYSGSSSCWYDDPYTTAGWCVGGGSVNFDTWQGAIVSYPF